MLYEFPRSSKGFFQPPLGCLRTMLTPNHSCHLGLIYGRRLRSDFAGTGQLLRQRIDGFHFPSTRVGQIGLVDPAFVGPAVFVLLSSWWVTNRSLCSVAG